jgi:hypothetical protein
MSLLGRRSGGADLGSATDHDRQVGVRLDSSAYAVLEALALREGVAPTTMARMLMRKALSDARAEAARGPLP